MLRSQSDPSRATAKLHCYSRHLGGPQPNPGTGFGVNVRGVAPYWRVAWQRTRGNNYLEVLRYPGGGRARVGEEQAKHEVLWQDATFSRLVDPRMHAIKLILNVFLNMSHPSHGSHSRLVSGHFSGINFCKSRRF